MHRRYIKQILRAYDRVGRRAASWICQHVVIRGVASNCEGRAADFSGSGGSMRNSVNATAPSRLTILWSPSALGAQRTRQERKVTTRYSGTTMGTPMLTRMRG